MAPDLTAMGLELVLHGYGDGVCVFDVAGGCDELDVALGDPVFKR